MKLLLKKICFIVSLLTCCCAMQVHGQIWTRIDSINFEKVQISRYKFINNIFQQTVNSIKRSPEDTNISDIVLNAKSEDPFLPFQGKIIRKITVNSLDFEKNFTDTLHRNPSFFGRVADAMHTNTRSFVVKNNLFIEENTPLNAFKVADNERYLRTLDYINDARIVVYKIKDNPDSVDINVITKDFFSISADGATDGMNRVNARIVDANVAGMGQRVEVTGLLDKHRDPGSAYGGLYRKANVAGSFVDATVGYSLMNVNNYTHEEEHVAYIQFDRQLVSPYLRFAGSLLLSHNQAYNFYNFPPSFFYKYTYNVYDGWIGYNLAIKQLTATNNTVRDRRFLSLRYFYHQFTDVPQQVGDHINPIFNDQQAILGQITFFRQNYYKTQYIYGFGTTEDLPYGYNISLIGGWHKQLSLERQYGGINAQQYIATHRGDFIQLYARAGGFLYKNTLQDAGYVVGATAFSRIYFVGSTKIRQYINTSYSELYNRNTTLPLRIDNSFGIRGFLSDSAYGSKRLSLQFETEFFLKYKILGFRFAPFPYGDLALINKEHEPFLKSSVYSSIGGGIRGRNENLVFQTIELRAYFFPVTPNNMRGFKLILTSNLRYRYQSNFINAPDFVQLN